ncbi:TMV resistance protein N-like [Trifolium medium]|uniref:TMV resistance protein N-like n=1 Tax=Trifolium medium TaxID=97028 RepID=A0A392M947_9FABA|nr:TMV resistance protein N-like [Trifolium medium]
MELARGTTVVLCSGFVTADCARRRMWCARRARAAVRKERHELEIVMPPSIKVPKWFDYRCKGGIPCLWVRGKFPNVALALVFQFSNEDMYMYYPSVDLRLVINGQCVTHKGYYNFRIEPNHVFVCDLRLLFNDEEWLSDALLLKHEWNQVQISYEALHGAVTLSEWGVFVYKQGTANWKEHVQFMCPTKDPIMTIEEFKHEDSNDATINENENHDDKTICIEDIPSSTGPEVDEIDHDTPMFEEKDEHEHITHEDFNDAAVNETENRDDKIIGIEDIPSPIDPEVDETQNIPYPSASGFFRRLLYTCFGKCFS